MLMNFKVQDFQSIKNYDFYLQFDSQGEKEMRMIFEGQNALHHVVKDLSKKLDELLGRQEMVLTRVSQISSGGAVQVPQGGAQQVKYKYFTLF